MFNTACHLTEKKIQIDIKKAFQLDFGHKSIFYVLGKISSARVKHYWKS